MSSFVTEVNRKCACTAEWRRNNNRKKIGFMTSSFVRIFFLVQIEFYMRNAGRRVPPNCLRPPIDSCRQLIILYLSRAMDRGCSKALRNVRKLTRNPAAILRRRVDCGAYGDNRYDKTFYACCRSLRHTGGDMRAQKTIGLLIAVCRNVIILQRTYGTLISFQWRLYTKFVGVIPGDMRYDLDVLQSIRCSVSQL